MKSLQVLLSTLAVMVVAAALVVGCGGKEDNPVTPGGGHDSRLVLEAGYAWIGEFSDDEFPVPITGAIVFNANGTGKMFVNFIIWFESGPFGWYTVGNNKLYRVDTDEDGVVDTSESTYSISGNTLTIVEGDGTRIELTKSQLDLIGTPGGDLDPELIDKAWMNEETGDTWAFMYDDEEGVGSAYFESGDGESFGLYYCSTSNGELILTGIMGSADATYPYSISGDVLTVNGVAYTLYEDDDDDWDAFKSRAKKALEKKLGKKLNKISLLK